VPARGAERKLRISRVFGGDLAELIVTAVGDVRLRAKSGRTLPSLKADGQRR